MALLARLRQPVRDGDSHQGHGDQHVAVLADAGIEVVKIPPCLWAKLLRQTARVEFPMRTHRSDADLWRDSLRRVLAEYAAYDNTATATSAAGRHTTEDVMPAAGPRAHARRRHPRRQPEGHRPLRAGAAACSRTPAPTAADLLVSAERRVVQHLPQVPVGVLEVARVDAPRPVAWLGEHRRARRPGGGEHGVDLVPGRHRVSNAELATRRRARRQTGVLDELRAGNRRRR
jgi:hypothetical protein